MLEDKDLVSVQEVRTKVERAWAALQEYRRSDQKQVDTIVEAMAAAARAEAGRLAQMAVEETGYGNVASKIAKNLLCADLLPRRMRGMKTIGVIREAREEGLIEIAEPAGVVAAILPTTNPTSTAIYKTLIALKSGNAIVISPHPRAKACTCATTEILKNAAIQAGAPEDLIQCIFNATMEGTNALMRHPRTGVILSTGGSGIVKAAYSSGKPAFGVGPGNVPVLIEDSADAAQAVRKVVEGKSFDYGTVCSSEQTIVACSTLRDKILGELKASKAYLCSSEQGKALTRVLFNDRLGVNADCVGQAPAKIAEKAGFAVPADVSILVVEIDGIGRQHPLSAEKLSPVLAVHFVNDFAAAVNACEAILRLGGLGHTCVIYSKDDGRILEYGRRMPAFRVLVNTPAPQGSTGITTNVFPSMTLGCGAIAGNITSDNVGPQHLMNIKRIAYEVRTAEQAFPDQGKQPALHSGAIDRNQIAGAVDRYLSQRGIRTSNLTATSGGGGIAAEVVDRFLARAKPSPRAPAEAGCCGPGQPAPPAASPEPAPADFVSEYDVRLAIRESRKIAIGPKTIVTPSARDLAAQHGVLVSTKPL
jgi:acetaldehyde dehydrogenase (acetylating)